MLSGEAQVSLFADEADVSLEVDLPLDVMLFGRVGDQEAEDMMNLTELREGLQAKNWADEGVVDEAVAMARTGKARRRFGPARSAGGLPPSRPGAAGVAAAGGGDSFHRIFDGLIPSMIVWPPHLRVISIPRDSADSWMMETLLDNIRFGAERKYEAADVWALCEEIGMERTVIEFGDHAVFAEREAKAGLGSMRVGKRGALTGTETAVEVGAALAARADAGGNTSKNTSEMMRVTVGQEVVDTEKTAPIESTQNFRAIRRFFSLPY